MTASEYHNMKLHEEADINGKYTVLRVAGGWIYTNMGGGSVFVPIDTEFVNREFYERKKEIEF